MTSQATEFWRKMNQEKEMFVADEDVHHCGLKFPMTMPLKVHIKQAERRKKAILKS